MTAASCGRCRLNHRPILADGVPPDHIVVITGYYSAPGLGGTEQKDVGINDPLLPAPYGAVFESADFTCLWRPAAVAIGAFDEAEVSLDSDGDGIVDFDEVERFGTDPNHADTDRDGLNDKDDVRESLFGMGVFISGPPGRDWDKDGVPMELDCDSDNDGIPDGEDDDNFSHPEIPKAAECETPEAYIGQTGMLQTGGGRMNEAVTQDILFVRDPNDPLRYESVSGTLTYSVSGPYFPDCEISGSITVPIEPGDADFEFITGIGLPSLMVGTGNTPGLEVPATVTCPDGTTFEVMAGTQIWFWPQESYQILTHLAGEFTPSFGDGNTTYTWDLYGTSAPP